MQVKKIMEKVNKVNIKSFIVLILIVLRLLENNLKIYCNKMSHKLKIGTLNIRGVGDYNKIRYVSEIVRCENVKILCLQETHVNESKQIEMIESAFNDFYAFVPKCDKKCRGVAILVKKDFIMNRDKIKQEYYIEERFLMINIMLNNGKNIN